MISARMIFLNSLKRISGVSSNYNIDQNKLKLNDFLFLIGNIPIEIKELINNLSSKHKPLFEIVGNRQEDTIIKVIPEISLLNSLNSGNAKFNHFITRLRNFFFKKNDIVWKFKNKTIEFGRKPLIMGILNVTPDSFYDGGLYLEKNRAVDKALAMIEDGADIIDVGGESTRPGARPVAEKKELKRVVPVIEEIRKHTKALISIDTYKSIVAEEALLADADIINDISGTTFDSKMKGVIEKHKCPVILMHTKGNPETMQNNPSYTDVIEEVYKFLDEKNFEIGKLNEGKVIIDPGIGFGKSLKDNLSLIEHIKDFTFINNAVLLGLSRKSFIKGINGTDMEDRLMGSLVSELYGVLNGADIIRVHDVYETNKARNILLALRES